MEIDWIAKRIQLWKLLQTPDYYTDQQLAHCVGMSRSWVQKWRPRLEGESGDHLHSFMSRSRRRKTSPRQVTEALEAQILHWRDSLTAQYGRRVGARNILYHLQQDPDLKRRVHFIPKAASTVHEVLVSYHRIPRPKPRIHIPREPAEPMQVWEMDFADIITAGSTRSDKQTHQVEMLDVIDSGSSVALATQVSDRFDAEWTLITLVDIFRATGLPKVIRFDRDPRLVASWTMNQFPSVLMRFLLCLGIRPDVCPPRRPDLKPYIERFIRTQKEECIYPKRPTTVAQAQQLLDDFQVFYNLDRPNQALSCGNQPPAVALEQPPYLPRLPAVVDPDAWLKHYHGQAFRRLVNSSGAVRVDHVTYYIGKRYAGQRAMLVLDAVNKQFDIWVNHQSVRQKAIQGLFHGELPLPDYVDAMVRAARSETKRLWYKRRLGA
jgi:hypothetical protein